MPKMQVVPSKRRVQAFISSIKDEYDRGSIIKDVMDIRRAAPQDSLTFVQIGAVYPVAPEVLVDSYSKTGPYTSPKIIGIGRSIAIGEEKYLINTLLAKITRKFNEKSFSLQTITHALKKMDSHFHPDSVFIPLDFYLTLHTNRAPDLRIEHPHGPESFLVLGSRMVRVFWSNKYNPFKNVIFVDRRIGQWIVKPDWDESRVMVDIGPFENMRFRTAVKTVACCSILDPKRGMILEIPLPRDREGHSV